MTKEEKQENEKYAKYLISDEINFVKNRLISISMDLASLKPGKAKSLDNIIGRLEDWQHRK